MKRLPLEVFQNECKILLVCDMLVGAQYSFAVDVSQNVKFMPKTGQGAVGGVFTTQGLDDHARQIGLADRAVDNCSSRSV